MKNKDFFIIGLVLFISLIHIYYNINRDNVINNYHNETKILLDSDKSDDVDVEKLYQYCKDLNIKYPEIVVSQAILETGWFTSNICRYNNNLFGMRISTSRPSTNICKDCDYAVYDDWKMSVIDYTFLQIKHADLSSEENYLNWLQATYAEAPDYIGKIKSIRKKLWK